MENKKGKTKKANRKLRYNKIMKERESKEKMRNKKKKN